MAIYHLHAQVISRSSGRSSVAASAYRSGEKLENERDGEVHDFTGKKGVVHSEISTPRYAPEWASDRAELWNRVEATEKRKDAQTAREIEIALPREMTHFERVELVRDYVEANFTEKGMVADWSIHNGKNNNPHAHIMLTMRQLEADGFGEKRREWNSSEQLNEWRKGWEKAVNKELVRYWDRRNEPQPPRIDCRTLEAQGIERAPQQHLGPQAAAMKERGLETYRTKAQDPEEAQTVNATREAKETREKIKKLRYYTKRVEQDENAKLPEWIERKLEPMFEAAEQPQKTQQQEPEQTKTGREQLEKLWAERQAKWDKEHGIEPGKGQGRSPERGRGRGRNGPDLPGL